MISKSKPWLKNFRVYVLTFSSVIVLVPNISLAQLRLSADSLYLTDQNGTPVFLNGESAWCLFTGLTLMEANAFLADCSTKGVNYLQTMLIEDGFTNNAPRNVYGVAPFSGEAFSTPVEGYFLHCDSVIGLAKFYGIYLQIYITYLGNGSGEGWQSEVGAASIATMKNYGAFIASRYRDSTNIVYGVSGDCDPTAWRQKIDSMVVGGILLHDTNHIISTRDELGTYAHTHWPNRPWLTLDGFYPYWGPLSFDVWRIYQMGWQGRQTVPKRPYLLQEAWYENEHTYGGSTYPTDAQLRQQMYYGPLGGSIAGQVFGNCPIWLFSRGAGLVCGPGHYTTWLNSQGRNNNMRCGRLFRSRHWYKLVPDVNQFVMTAGYGTIGTGTYATTSFTHDSSSIIAYLPTSRTVTVNSAVLNGDSIHVFWFSPGDGVVTDMGLFSNTSRVYSPPGPGDWVLVIDSRAFEGIFDVPGGDPPPVQTAVNETPPLPSVVNLSQNYPNPFNPTTTISYDTPVRSTLSLEVFDTAGRKIRTLAHGIHPAGRYSLQWDGKDDSGRTVGSGIYFYQLRAGEVWLTKKMALIK